MEDARLVEPAIGVGAEIVAQALKQISRTAGAPQSVEIGERRSEGGRRHAKPIQDNARGTSARKAYRAKIEQYEIPYLQQKQKDIALDRNILNKDPVDNPISSDSQTQSLQNQRQQSIDTRTPKP